MNHSSIFQFRELKNTIEKAFPLGGMAQATLSARFAGIHLGWREATEEGKIRRAPGQHRIRQGAFDTASP